ncbi:MULTISPECIES: sensor histidine kinase [Streptomycetaceae]|uniref:histidine kinase n=1 Tax=Streptantibioticus cattleyicolor (strain ATCC 35852 / DSM 46488 / JCM 4925 / NBRC 14057 / NRRL 8057) TaxID=1003195 RepID=F8JTU1_STREN|nr:MULTISPECIES: sensor histidine kinase [Streptomycetaceae]AEW98030.1 two-component system sensor kinase [Streptantibioticus cattleyicolor NRRL 8057 = DSM 46488]MYS62425.1 sensor histidine kinase [Streptomyces sp. SID5468]CCB78347.1 putative two-component system sensor kinase [Streptantibioticus cattleyicolor NRRL 8057 = DSM 46488]
MRYTARLRRLAPQTVEGLARDTKFLVTGLLIQFTALAIMASPWLYFVPASMAAITVAVVIPLAFLVVAAPVLSKAQRLRFRLQLGVDIPVPATESTRPAGLAGIPMSLDPSAEWRQLGYHLLIGPLIALGGVLTLLLWLPAAVAATSCAWVWAVPVDWRLAHHGYSTQVGYVTAGGIVVLCLLPTLSRKLVRLDVQAATSLLGPSPAQQLARRVEDLTQSRAGVLDAADTERRRIERDLHDGAQQRLVSLAVNLGMAKATLTDLPDQARAVIDEAHREAKEAIAELSDLVRGLHPAVLEDRGLDAALSAVAARVPIPVRLSVDLPSRPSPTVEAVAYFVVSEALTNAVKHASASGADVTVERIGDTLLVVVADDGVGGADATAGTGLSGLAKRVASVDGTFSVSSPVGGPTVLTVELPCAP